MRSRRVTRPVIRGVGRVRDPRHPRLQNYFAFFVLLIFIVLLISHLSWDKESLALIAKMSDRGHRRSPSVCRDRWRSLVRKLKNKQNQSPLAFFKDPTFNSSLPQPLQSLPKGLESSKISVMAQDCPLQNGKTMWGQRDGTSADVPQWDSGMGCKPVSTQLPTGRVIVVKWGGMSRRIGTDGSANAIRDAIRSAFGLRSKRSFWVEDEDGVVRSFDRAMPQTTYTLLIDPGVTIKLYHYDECNRQATNGEDTTLYNEDDFHELLARKKWQSLREVGTFKEVESIQDLRPMASYHNSAFKDTNL